MKRATEMVQLVESYHSQHSIGTFRREDKNTICHHRQYILIENVQCDSLGNNLGKYLHSLVVAVLFNRTVILQGSNHCHNLLAYQSWIVTYEQLESRITSACPHVLSSLRHPSSPSYACNFDTSNVSVVSFVSLQNRAFDHFNTLSGVSFSKSETYARRGIMFSCPIYENGRFEIYGLIFEKFMEVSPTIIDYLSEDWEALRQYEKGDEEEKEREEDRQQENREKVGTRLMLSSPPKPSSSSSSFSSNFSFLFPSHSSSPPPSSSSSSSSSSSTSLLKIAVHLRHRSVHMNITAFDMHFAGHRTYQLLIHVIRQIWKTNVNDVRGRPKCVLLIATDRLETLQYIIDVANELECRPFHVHKSSPLISPCQLEANEIHSDKTRETNTTTTTTATTTHEKHNDDQATSDKPVYGCSDIGEHGPWANDLLVVSDLVFLSQGGRPGQYYFVGSIESTFSQLIANRIAYRNMITGYSPDAIYWIPPQSQGKYYNNLVNQNLCKKV